MLFPELQSPDDAYYRGEYYGIDDPKRISAYNKKYSFDKHIAPIDFYNYPKTISYNFNSRGFRDEEWPIDISELSKCNFVIGDSNVIGTGLPLEDVYVNKLQDDKNQRFINCGKVDDIYDWLVCKSLLICKSIKPKKLIIHWSVFHRVKALPSQKITLNKNLKYINYSLNCIETIEKYKNTTDVIFIFNPEYHDYYYFLNKIEEYKVKHVLFCKQDYARDGVHYGQKSHSTLAKKILQYL